ncbi:N-acetylmuramoyl-L-alanine amidase [Rhodoflexus sp.]
MQRRRVDFIILHCTASPQSWGWQALRDYFLKTLRWSREGYHVAVEANGTVKRLVDNELPANGTRTFVDPNGRIFANVNAIHIAWIGGIDRQGNAVVNMTEPQLRSLQNVLTWYEINYPNATFLGHNQVAAKMCPCLDARRFLPTLGIPANRIYQHDNFNINRFNIPRVKNESGIRLS